jgi:hypothetical protein
MGIPPSVSSSKQFFSSKADPIISEAGQARAQRTIESVLSALAMLGALKIRATQTINAFSIYALSGEQIPIEHAPVSANDWKNLLPDLDKKYPGATPASFSRGHMRRDHSPHVQKAELIASCAEWLRMRRSQGVTLRKLLAPEARGHFGPQLTARIFAEAYKATFNRKRGRPPKEK